MKIASTNITVDLNWVAFWLMLGWCASSMSSCAVQEAKYNFETQVKIEQLKSK